MRAFTMRVAVFILAYLTLLPPASVTGASEIGDYLRQSAWAALATSGRVGLRVDSLAEDLDYSTRTRGEPITGSPMMEQCQPFMH